ncbi:MAG: radical SAM protein [Bacillota bacterium]
MLFEQGPIRPPSEAKSLLLRLTRNCPWNRCLFCNTYSGESFSRRPVDEIKRDVDAVAGIIDRLREESSRMGCGGEIDGNVLAEVYRGGNYQVMHVASWLYQGGRTVFLQDANSLIMKTAELVEVIRYIRDRLPTVERLTSYARSGTLLRKSREELLEIRAAGLERLHVGMESGSDAVLEFMRKGVTAAGHAEAGRKAVEAGFSLCLYVILGLGGRLWPEEHPVETARVLNQINPDYIRFRTLAVPEDTALYAKLAAGEFSEQTEDEIVAGERLLIERLEGINSRVVSDHMLNLLEEVRGKLPGDKEYMLSVIDRYLSLPESERINFRLGKRAGLYRRLDDRLDPVRHARVEAVVQRLGGRLDGTISSMMANML